MNARIYLSASVVVALFLTGCHHNPPVTVPQYVGFELSSELTDPIKGAAPPKRSEFLKAPVAKQRDMLFEYNVGLMATIKKLNNRLSEIRGVVDKNTARIDEMNKSVEKKP